MQVHDPNRYPRPPLSVWIRRWVLCGLFRSPFFEIKRAYDKATDHGVPIDWDMLATHRMAAPSKEAGTE